MAKSNYTVIRGSGKPMWFPDYEYLDVLREVYDEYNTAGGNWDRPQKLLRGDKVVIEKGLSDVAYSYGMRLHQLRAALKDQIKAEFQPEWEKEE